MTIVFYTHVGSHWHWSDHSPKPKPYNYFMVAHQKDNHSTFTTLIMFFCSCTSFTFLSFLCFSVAFHDNMSWIICHFFLPFPVWWGRRELKGISSKIVGGWLIKGDRPFLPSFLLSPFNIFSSISISFVVVMIATCSFSSDLWHVYRVWRNLLHRMVGFWGKEWWESRRKIVALMMMMRESCREQKRDQKMT